MNAVPPSRPLVPRWAVGGYAVLWGLGLGFVWWPLVLVRMVLVGRWANPRLGFAVAGTAGFLALALSHAAATGAPLGRLVAAAYLLVPWAVLLVASLKSWLPSDARALGAGIVDLAVIQGLLVLLARLVYPSGQGWRLPLGMLVPDSVSKQPPLDAWLVERLAFPDYYAGRVVRTAGIFGNPTWAGALSAVALLVLAFRCSWFVGRRGGPLAYGWPLAAAAICVGPLLVAYSRNGVLGLVLGGSAGLALLGLLRLSSRARLVSVAVLVAAGAAAYALVDVAALYRSYNSARVGSLDSRQAIYAQTLQRIHENPFWLGSGIKEVHPGLVASLGTHSTLLGLVYRGGWPALWGFAAFLLGLAGLAIHRRSALALALVVFSAFWATAEDIDAGHLVPLGLVLALALTSRPAPVPPSQALADTLVRTWDRGGTDVVTWLNHSSALRCEDLPDAVLESFTFVGVDGNGLRLLLDPGMRRTSADLVLPLVLPRLAGARVAVIGGSPEGLAGRVRALGSLLGQSACVVAAVDGFAGRPTGPALSEWLRRYRPDVVLVAMGARRQEIVACDVARELPRGLVATCGGFLDQLEHGSYYPTWAYPLRLNWAVRLAREPRRMWRRYTIDVLLAIGRRRRLAGATLRRPGYVACRSLLDPAPVAESA